MIDASGLIVLGHRGAAIHAPENTLAGLRAAHALGADGVEFDVMLSRDGQAMLMHDETLERTTDGSGPVAARDWREIAGLDAGAWFDAKFAGEPVPTLESALDLAASLGLMVNVEIKPTAGSERQTGALVAAQVAALWPAAAPAPLLSSFQEASLAAARDAAPALELALLVWDFPGDWRSRADALGCRALHCNHERLSAAQAAAVVAAGYALRCYTVNEPARARQLAGWGASAVISDCPDRILAG